MKLTVIRCDRCGIEETAASHQAHDISILRGGVNLSGCVGSGSATSGDLDLCEDCAEGLAEMTTKAVTAYLTSRKKTATRELVETAAAQPAN